MLFLLTYIDVKTVTLSAFWILIGQFKFQVHQLHARRKENPEDKFHESNTKTGYLYCYT